MAATLNNLAAVAAADGQLDKAERLYRRSLAIEEEIFGPEHPRVAARLNNLAQLMIQGSSHVNPEPLLQRALSIREKALGPAHPDVALSLNSLADFYRAESSGTQQNVSCSAPWQP